MDKLFIYFAQNSCNGVDTNVLNCEGGGIGTIIRIVLNILFSGIAVCATIGLIFVGVKIITARDNESQVATAKKRAIEIVIGLVAATLVWIVVPMFLPGVSQGGVDSAIADINESTKYVEPPKTETPNNNNNNGNNGGNNGANPTTPTDDKCAYSISDAVWNNNNECSSAKVWPAKKYALTEEEISYFSELVAIENCRGGSSSNSEETVAFGCRLLATQIINLYEERGYNRNYKEGCTSGACYYKDLKKWITHDKWYNVNHNAGIQPGKYSNSRSRAAVIEVIVNGNRAMPKFVSRYDGLYHWTNPSYSNSSYWGMNSLSEAAQAKPMKTQVKSGERYLWCIERKQTSNSYNGPYNEVFNYDDAYRRAVGM